MKKKKLYELLPFFVLGICMAGTVVVGTRIFAKKVLIGKLGIENKITCTLADYNWGDRLERTWVDKDELPESSARLQELEAILAQAPKDEDATEDAKQVSMLERLEQKVQTIESDVEKYCNEKFMLYTPLRNLSAGYDTVAHWDIAYARTEGSTYTLDTGFDYQAVEQVDTTAYADKIMTEQRIAESAGVDYLYVQLPYRVDEENSQVPWGVSSYENENADAVLETLQGASVSVLDLREALRNTGWENNTGFYQTDGHWTTRSGFTSAGIVADYLNENFGFSYDVAIFDEANYEVKRYGLNNYAVDEEVELFLPDFTTSLSVMDAYRGEEYRGEFTETCFDMSKAETEEYSSVLTAYSASRIRNSYLFEYENLDQVNNQKRILVSADSFSWHLLPYLALDTAYVDYVYKMTPEQLEYYIETLQPDIVIRLDRSYEE